MNREINFLSKDFLFSLSLFDIICQRESAKGETVVDFEIMAKTFTTELIVDYIGYYMDISLFY